MTEPADGFHDTTPSGYADADAAEPAAAGTAIAATPASPPRPFWHWLIEGARTAVFMRPRTAGLLAGPKTVLTLLVLLVLVGAALESVSVDATQRGYVKTAIEACGVWLVMVGICWIVVRSRTVPSGSAAVPTHEPDTPTLFGVVLAQELVISPLLGLLLVLLGEPDRWYAALQAGAMVYLAVACFVGVVGWMFLAPTLLLWRQASRRGPQQIKARVAVLAGMALMAGAPLFVAADSGAFDVEESAPADLAATERPGLQLTQDLIESQAHALPDALEQLQPGRPGIVDLYAITFAPYAEEDVFSREAGLVSELMRSRFDAPQRTVQLQNHARTAADMPWATPHNLQRTIQRMAELMNRDEDIVFIHLTSHGARNGHLAASFWPIEVDEVTPQLLKTWLDDAGVRLRVISISACFSGSWIAPLSDPGTLVMTAADADHTSYGCGRKSDLTFFGRAMYDEQLRHGFSFEAAHAAVRPVIEQREKDAGKDDGFSNPQIAVGAAIRGPLASLEQRLSALPAASR